MTLRISWRMDEVNGIGASWILGGGGGRGVLFIGERWNALSKAFAISFSFHSVVTFVTFVKPFAFGDRGPTPKIAILGAQDWMRVYPISTSFWPFRLIFSAFVFVFHCRVWAPCGSVGTDSWRLDGLTWLFTTNRVHSRLQGGSGTNLVPRLLNLGTRLVSHEACVRSVSTLTCQFQSSVQSVGLWCAQAPGARDATLRARMSVTRGRMYRGVVRIRSVWSNGWELGISTRAAGQGERLHVVPRRQWNNDQQVHLVYSELSHFKPFLITRDRHSYLGTRPPPYAAACDFLQDDMYSRP